MIQLKASGFSVKHLDRNWNCGMQMSQDRRITLWFHGPTTNKSSTSEINNLHIARSHFSMATWIMYRTKIDQKPKNRRAYIKVSVWISWNLHGPLSLKSLKSVSSFFQCTCPASPNLPYVSLKASERWWNLYPGRLKTSQGQYRSVQFCSLLAHYHITPSPGLWLWMPGHQRNAQSCHWCWSQLEPEGVKWELPHGEAQRRGKAFRSGNAALNAR